MENAGTAMTRVASRIAAAFGGIKLGQLVRDAVLMSARYETLGVTMAVVGRNAGYTVSQMRDFEQTLRETGIAGIEARQSLARLSQANIELSKSSDLARIAQDAAVISGTNSSAAFQQLVYGIQSANVRILRTVGLNVQWEQGYQSLARQLGKATAELTEQEKATARLNTVIGAGEQIAGAYEAAMETAGKQLGSMKRLTDDLMVSLGNALLPTFTDLIADATLRLKDSQQWVNQNQVALRYWAETAVLAGQAVLGVFTGIGRILFNIGQQIGEVANFIGAALAGRWDDAAAAAERIRGNWQDIGDTLDANKERWTALLDQIVNVDDAADKAAEDLRRSQEAMAAVGEVAVVAAEAGTEAFEGLIETALRLSDRAFQAAADQLDKFNDKLKVARDLYEETRTPLEAYNLRIAELDKLLAQNVISQDIHARAVRQATQALREQQDAANDDADALSRLSGVLGRLSGLFGAFGFSFPGFSQLSSVASFAGGFQHGGTIPAGQFGLVGESGPELVSGPASVTPAADPGALASEILARVGPPPEIASPDAVAADRWWRRLHAAQVEVGKHDGVRYDR